MIMKLGTILFIIVMLHLAIGFGYVLYKLEFSGKKSVSKKEDIDKKEHNKEQS